MIVKVLGSGCPTCLKLEENVKEAVKDLGLENVQIEHVTEIDQIIGYGVMSTPALVVDEEVKSTGRLLDVEEIKSLLKNN